ncbi:TolC family protein [Ideonella sp.]|uniref:TolC family protein n=1 Tax=Ideonella sp. TaxID=1929293 RepID=UPI003BB5B915
MKPPFDPSLRSRSRHGRVAPVPALLWAAAIVLALGSAGCASGGPGAAQRPTEGELPVRWQLDAPPAAGEAAEVVWDRALRALQQQALQSNRDLAQAALRWQRARSQQQQGDLRWQPSLSLGPSASRALDSGTPTSAWQRSASASLSVGYELDLWGRLAQGNTALQAQTGSARADIEAARVLILSQVAERYWTVAALRTQQPWAAEQAALSEEALQITMVRVREGKLLPIEVDKAGATLLDARLRVSNLAADLQLERRQLALLLARTDGTVAELDAAQLPPQAPPDWALPAPAQALAQRPDVQRARLGVDAALARLSVAEAERYPRLSLSASVATGSSGWRDWLNQPLMSLAANLTVPLVDWQRLDLQRDDARTDLELAALDLRSTLHKSLVEVESQVIERQRLAQQQAAAAARLRDATQAEALARLRLEVGSIGRIDWVQARSARLAAEQDLTQLQLSRWLNHAGLYKVLGQTLP